MAKKVAVLFIALERGILSKTSMASYAVVLDHIDMSVCFWRAGVEFDISCSE